MTHESILVESGDGGIRAAVEAGECPSGHGSLGSDGRCEGCGGWYEVDPDGTVSLDYGCVAGPAKGTRWPWRGDA